MSVGLASDSGCFRAELTKSDRPASPAERLPFLKQQRLIRTDVWMNSLVEENTFQIGRGRLREPNARLQLFKAVLIPSSGGGGAGISKKPGIRI